MNDQTDFIDLTAEDQLHAIKRQAGDLRGMLDAYGANGGNVRALIEDLSGQLKMVHEWHKPTVILHLENGVLQPAEVTDRVKIIFVDEDDNADEPVIVYNDFDTTIIQGKEHSKILKIPRKYTGFQDFAAHPVQEDEEGHIERLDPSEDSNRWAVYAYDYEDRQHCIADFYGETAKYLAEEFAETMNNK